MRTLGLQLLWLAAGFGLLFLTALGWSAALAVLMVAVSEQEPPPGFLTALSFLFGTFAVFLLGLVPGVALAILSWPAAARRFPRIESRDSLPVSTFVVAVAIAIVVTVLLVGFRTPPFVLAIVAAGSWLPLVGPRLVLRRLAPGAFLARTA